MKKIILIACSFISLQALAFDTWWHAECTRKAMVANGFSSDARLATQVSNYITDFMAALNMPNELMDKAGISSLHLRSDHSYDFLHFDAIFTEQDIEQNWQRILANTVAALRKYANGAGVEEGFRQIIIFNIIGASLHAIQDFYSHSNWVNLHIQQRLLPVPIWFDVSPEDRKKMKLFTGIYQKPYNGHVSHEELNKDNSARALNKQAVETAERASIDWVKRLMDSVPGIAWSQLKSYTIQNNMVMKNFLVKLDASFVTSSSIVPGHFDGQNPAKKVFNDDLSKEKFQAMQVLEATLGSYTNNMAVSSNKYKLPTPYWAGFMGYNISKLLADGLMLNKERFVNSP
jgi:hypothetical protein